jgi:hypothetical protein
MATDVMNGQPKESEMSEQITLSDRASALRAEHQSIEGALAEVATFDAALALLQRKAAIQTEVSAIAYARAGRERRERREDVERAQAERAARNAKLRARLSEVRVLLENETNGAERDRLGRERDALADQIRWG